RDGNALRESTAGLSCCWHQPVCLSLSAGQGTRQLQGRYTLFTLSQQIDGQKPFLQRQLRTMENGAGGERGLMVAFVALIYLAALEPTSQAYQTNEVGTLLYYKFREIRAIRDLFGIG
ncbi:hypothetical protein BOV89_12620, partial [Solemya velum gill symbiont]